MYVLTALSVLLSLLLVMVVLGLPHLRKNDYRVIGWVLCCLTLPVFIGGIVLQSPSLVVSALLFLASYSRLVPVRYGRRRAVSMTKRATAYTLCVGLSLGLIELWYRSSAQAHEWIVVVFIASHMLLALRGLVLVSTRMIHARIPRDSTRQHEHVPTVTIAIPARNETHALTDCLRAAVATNYPRLEILVLDDCSQDSSPEIIRSFAHDGVRFVQGTDPASRWIGKNHAYQTLLEQASGEYVVFLGVDVHLGEHSIGQLVAFATTHAAHMVSVMPKNRSAQLSTMLMHPLRHYRTLLFQQLPLTSSCWIVKRSWLLDQGGFGLYPHAITPEFDIARSAQAMGGYHFLASTSAQLAITNRKHIASIVETAKRTLYPQLKKNPVAVLSRAAWLTIAVCWLPILALSSTGAHYQVAAIFTLSVYALSGALVTRILYARRAWLGPVLFIANTLSEVMLSIWSYVQYEFGNVRWKGRNVCLPVMKYNGVHISADERVREETERLL